MELCVMMLYVRRFSATSGLQWTGTTDEKRSVSSCSVLHRCVFSGCWTLMFSRCHQSTKVVRTKFLLLSWEIETGFSKTMVSMTTVWPFKFGKNPPTGLPSSSHIKSSRRFCAHSRGFFPNQAAALWHLKIIKKDAASLLSVSASSGGLLRWTGSGGAQ